LAGTAALTAGSAVVTGTGTQFDSYLSPGSIVVFGTDPAQYTVQSVDSSTQITLTQPYAGSLSSGVTVYGPFNTPPTPSQINVENHALVLQRDESTGGIDKLYEYYNTSSNDGGATWLSAGGAQWDLTTGAPRPEQWTSADAAGLPITPLLVTYDQAAADQINHPLRLVLGTDASYNYFVWPARHAVNTGSFTTGLPMGSRLRLSDAWYQANRASFSPIMQSILDAMRNYGLIVADLAPGSTFQIDGVADSRWNTNDLRQLRTIPVSAFEVLDTIKSPMTFTGPTTGSVGQAQTFTVQYLNSQDSNFSSNIHLYYCSFA
jgi:hypothetical protein